MIGVGVEGTTELCDPPDIKTSTECRLGGEPSKSMNRLTNEAPTRDVK